ncbi:MAG: YkgJ family cysteine cluster protein [Alphaproteobacteria bacterium]|nr:YkgJ family cysteine cluster protein [Alphaproteobacteria bacterium]
MRRTARRVHPCLSCGACCAAYRVSFYWAEADDGHGEVPVGLTVPISPHLRAMAGTHRAPPRCVALMGDVGQRVACSIYAKRSSTCREFEPSWESGRHNPACDKARALHGLPPLKPERWRRRPTVWRRAA